MNLSHSTFLSLLQGDDAFYSLKEDQPGFLNPDEMAHLYINSALLVTIMIFLKEQLWLKDRDELQSHLSYREFLTPLFEDELAPVEFLKEFLIDVGAKGIKKLGKDAEIIESNILDLILNRSPEDQKSFAIQSLKEMRQHFIDEENNQDGRDLSLGHKGLRLYRTFDHIDILFDLNYQLDKDMVVDYETKERLYQQSGVGVQSGYSSIILALQVASPAKDSTIIDLGSGYGRVGLVCALLRSDINFIGYEYVPHRVEVSNCASSALELDHKLQFITQDLSLESFKIPVANIYYLYDPFTEETYRHVLEQIVELSKKQKVTVVTKGNASAWLTEISDRHSWPAPLSIDQGNLRVFRSS